MCDFLVSLVGRRLLGFRGIASLSAMVSGPGVALARAMASP